ncbi:hypothetical protein BCR43DRAFT_490484 [Syncephalastrum racemosum]|uniref:Uncharacterized protein n=1 Tax=Syncephalastrum racemosum TaxID=13706 RepID=A0A1X2HHE2_SYNRA|nr:hypothetical protein BCR43DRAFT_490484 [Syncephalastrum racemosum]
MAHSMGTLKRRLNTVLLDARRTRSFWHQLVTDAFPVVNEVVNTVIQAKYVDNPAYWHPALTLSFPNIKQAYYKKTQALIQERHASLESFIERMNKQIQKMQQQASEIHAICQRAEQLSDASFVQNTPLFATCPMVLFDTRLRAIVTMYEKTMQTLEAMTEKGFKHIKERDEGLALLSIWLHLPDLDDATIEEFNDLCQVELPER